MAEISVIIPVYKAEAYLAECIDSILGQTFRDLELILIDDGSPDNCAEICREYARRDSRVRFLQQENRGQAAARNHAMKVAEGQWICFIDSDDVIHPQYLQILYDAARDNDVPISMCRYLGAETMPEGFLDPCEPEIQVLNMEEASLAELYDREEYPGWVACTKLVRREIVEGYPFTEGRIFEDNEAVCRWIIQAKRIASVDYYLYYYRTYNGGTTRSSFSLKKLDYLWALESITAFYGSIGYEKLQQRFFRRYVDAAVNACYGVRLELEKPELAKTISKQVREASRHHKLPLLHEERVALLDAAHPGLIRLYWPVEAVLRRLGLYKGEGQ